MWPFKKKEKEKRQINVKKANVIVTEKDDKQYSFTLTGFFSYQAPHFWLNITTPLDQISTNIKEFGVVRLESNKFINMDCVKYIEIDECDFFVEE